MEMKEILVLGVIILFISVAFAPCINISVVKASKDSDLVEVTTQACGIQGFGDTTVKLSRERYQDLEQYLVEFRARLNCSTSAEETSELFKETVSELHEYGLLPKGMSVAFAQRLVTIKNSNSIFHRDSHSIRSSELVNDYENYDCLIAGVTTNTASQGPLLAMKHYTAYYASKLWSNLWYLFYPNHQLLMALWEVIDHLWGPFYMLNIIGVGNIVSNLNPIQFLSVIGLGRFSLLPFRESVPASGWIYTNGTNGTRKWSGELWGNIFNFDTIEQLVVNINWWGIFSSFCPGIAGFIGLKIGFIPDFSSFYIGHASQVKVRFAE